MGQNAEYALKRAEWSTDFTEAQFVESLRRDGYRDGMIATLIEVRRRAHAQIDSSGAGS